MLPLESSEAGVRTFFIARHGFGCCFGSVPLPHELVACDVGTEDGRKALLSACPARVFHGNLHRCRCKFRANYFFL